MAFYRGWRYAAFISGLVGFIGLAMYPIAISPMIDSSEYKKIQKEARKNIRQEDIQPGNISMINYVPQIFNFHTISYFYLMQAVLRYNWRYTSLFFRAMSPLKTTGNDMKIWTDPFGRKKPDSE